MANYKMHKKVEVKQDPEKPIPAELMAQAIVDIADAMKKLNASRLTRAAIVTLIKDKSGIDKNKIEIVLNNLDELERNWLKKK